VPALPLPVYVNAAWPLPSVVPMPDWLRFGPEITAKFTRAPAKATPLEVTVAVTVCAVPTAFVANAGTSEHTMSGTQRFGGKSAENSLVLPSGSVAVAVKIGPMGTALSVTLKVLV